MSDKYTDLLDTADRIAVVDLYPARLRTVISDLSAALRKTSALLTESRDYGSALVEELRARTEKLDQLLLLANSMDADFESYTKVHPAVQPKVKPLVWHEGDEPDEWKSGPYDVWREFGRYQLYHWSVVVGEPHKTASAAKAAAQADHEARILSALEPAVQPDAVQPGAATLMRWHDMLMQDFGDDLSSVVRDEMLALIDKPAVQPDLTDPAGNLTARGNAATWALYDANLTRMGALQPSHVNETPKSEHDERVMLTPATKGERDD